MWVSHKCEFGKRRFSHKCEISKGRVESSYVMYQYDPAVLINTIFVPDRMKIALTIFFFETQFQKILDQLEKYSTPLENTTCFHV